MTKAIIGITSLCGEEKTKKYNKVRCSYVDAVYKAGGIPIIIPPFENLKLSSKYIDLIDALILSGGSDITPEIYGESKLPEVKDNNVFRDKWEIELFNKAYEKNIPILGICRGMQLINVALGGNLYQDIDLQLNCDSPHLPIELQRKKNLEYEKHQVNILKNSQLDKIVCSEKIHVNSHHHQAIKNLAEDLTISAKSECGITEAVEVKNKNFLIGVQWHPEDLIDSLTCFNNLFSALINAAATKKSNGKN